MILHLITDKGSKRDLIVKDSVYSLKQLHKTFCVCCDPVWKGYPLARNRNVLSSKIDPLLYSFCYDHLNDNLAFDPKWVIQ